MTRANNTNPGTRHRSRHGLAWIAVAVLVSFSQIAAAQTPCTVERGADPLDVLNSGVRHNVWVVLDASGSMRNSFAGQGSKLAVAQQVLNQLMDELVDASGRPLVNWAFSYYDRQNRQAPVCSRPDFDGGKNGSGKIGNWRRGMVSCEKNKSEKGHPYS